ncbi:MAG: ATP-binding protein [Pseudomonadota bacterium]
MTLRHRLYAYLGGIHLALFAFTVVLYRDRPPLFVLLEVLLLASLAGGVHLVRRALEPLDYAHRFHDLLQDQDYSARLHDTPDGDLGELVALFNRMLGALYAERLKIGEQQGFLDRLLEATPSAVVVYDFDGRVSLMNPSAQALFQSGGAALLAQMDALPPGESMLLTDPDGRRYRGQRGHFFDRGFARDFLLVDELTEELESSERATYEKLIRVLAHEVNNTVAATGSVLDSLLFYSSQLNERDSADFSTATIAVKRRNASLGEFIERFTRVVKMPAPELRPTDVKAMLDDIVTLYREPCRLRGIGIGWGVCADLPALPLDRHLMEQALVNIVKNAMEAADGGSITLELRRESGVARLSILDSGNRLVDVPARQLFTPFFTTKKGGQGIGLLFVREVLQRHDFNYRLAANGQGQTCFDIWFGNAR